MYQRFVCFCREKVGRITNTIVKNKGIFILVAVAIGIGVLWALSGTEKAAEKYSDGNMITKIASENFSYLPYLLKTFFFSVLFYLLASFTCFNRVAFLANYVFIAVFTTFFMKRGFVSIALDGMSGIILLFIYYLPVLVFNGLCFAMFLSRLYENTCAGTNWKYCAPFFCSVKTGLPLVKRFVLLSVVVNLAYATILVVLLSVVL